MYLHTIKKSCLNSWEPRKYFEGHQRAGEREYQAEGNARRADSRHCRCERKNIAEPPVDSEGAWS